MRRIEPVLASGEQLTVYHMSENLARVAEIAQTDGGDTGPGAPIGRGGDRIARLAAGGTIAAVDAVLTGAVDAAYALVCPPGHHAMADEGMGFCVFNNCRPRGTAGAASPRGGPRADRQFWMCITATGRRPRSGTITAFCSSRCTKTISIHLGGERPTKLALERERASRSTVRYRPAQEIGATPRRSQPSSCRLPGNSILTW